MASLLPVAGLAASVIEYPIAGSSLEGVASGPDGNLWLTDAGQNAIDRFTLAGQVTVYKLPTTNALPVDITMGPDNNLWFNEENQIVNHLGRITKDGTITEFPTDSGQVVGIATGSDGNLWFNERDNFAVAKMTTAGFVTHYLIPGGINGGPNPSADPIGITAGPDGNLWVTDESENVIWKVTTAGVFTKYQLPFSNPLPGNPSGNRGANAITTGADGNLWIGEASQNSIGRMTRKGVLTEFPIPIANAGMAGIQAGPDGNVWFTEMNADQVAMITPSGTITEIPIPTASSLPRRPASGPNGRVWFPEGVGNLAEVVDFPAPPKVGWSQRPRAGSTMSPPNQPWYVAPTAPPVGKGPGGGGSIPQTATPATSHAPRAWTSNAVLVAQILRAMAQLATF